jgi:hypothetical protein
MKLLNDADRGCPATDPAFSGMTRPRRKRGAASQDRWLGLCRARRWWIVGLLIAALARALSQSSESAAVEPRPPRLSPDYAGLIIPPNIAPLNFAIDEPEVARHEVALVPARGPAIVVRGRGATVRFPLRRWQALLQTNQGESLVYDIRVQGPDARWRRFAPVTNRVSLDPMDGFLVYRMLRPVYNIYGPMGIYQRDLGSFEQRPVLENRRLEDGCLNCHTFLQHQPDQLALHIRHRGAGNPMLLVESNQVTRLNKTSGYLAWHPSGRLLTFSLNRFSLLFHTAGETRDLFDSASDLGIYRVDSNQVVTIPALAAPDQCETWPSWAPDGQHLYFCRAPKLRMERFKYVRYDLARIPYDLDRDQWGEPEVLVSARETRLSAAQPRVSPDGRWLLFCLSPYGNFPAYSPGADLYLMDLTTRQSRRLEINSDQSDSYHSWSSNSRWVVFSSKRRDQLFTRPYFSHVDAQGRFSKPFILPQQDPDYYDSLTRIYNVPEFVMGPVTVTQDALVRGALRPSRVLQPHTDPKTTTPVPDHEANEGRYRDPRVGASSSPPP